MEAPVAVSVVELALSVVLIALPMAPYAAWPSPLPSLRSSKAPMRSGRRSPPCDPRAGLTPIPSAARVS